MKSYYEDKWVTIYHGDCREILPELPDKSVDLVLTDPPYGILPNGKPTDKFDWDNIEISQFTSHWFKLVFDKLSSNSFFFTFWSQKYLNKGIEIFKPDRVILWHYGNLTLVSSGDFVFDYEPLLLVRKGKLKLLPGKHSCILSYTKPQSNFIKDKLLHPTQKPANLIEHLISITNCYNILDPFLGSGTTCYCAKKLGRKSIGIETVEKYCEIAARRCSQEVMELK